MKLDLAVTGNIYEHFVISCGKNSIILIQRISTNDYTFLTSLFLKYFAIQLVFRSKSHKKKLQRLSDIVNGSNYTNNLKCELFIPY